MKNLAFILVAASMIAISCSQGPKGNKAETTDAYGINAAGGDTLTACQHQSKLYWHGTKPGGAHNGIIKLAEGGYFITNGDQVTGGKFIIDMNSIVCLDLEDAEWNGKLVGHLKSPDFFSVDSFPAAEFVISGVTPLEGDAEFSHTVQGNLTLKGITKGISFKAKINVTDGKVNAVSEEFYLNRTLWGVNYGSKSIFKDLADKYIDDNFSLKIEVYNM